MVSDKLGAIHSNHLRKANRSAFPIRFPGDPHTPGRSFTPTSFLNRERMADAISSSFPFTLNLDINRFYGSIYTHSLPWAILGKEEGQSRYRDGTLEKHWSSETDKLLRACNNNQTIGIPIGPDTSRIASEIVLARIDIELDKSLKSNIGDEYYHNIDDYKFGSMSIQECDSIKATFEREIRKFELRSREDKEVISDSITNENHAWVKELNLISSLKGKDFLDSLFSIISAHRELSPNANILGYSLSRYSKRISSYSTRDHAISHLQRLLFSVPWAVTFVAPLLIGLKRNEGLSSAQMRLIQYGIKDGLRKHDVISVLWYLYLYLRFDQTLGAALCEHCIDLDCSLVDLMLAHMDQKNLLNASDASSILSKRHAARDLSSPSWLYLYETERRGWTPKEYQKKIKRSKTNKVDPGSFFVFAEKNGVEFYDPSAFGLDVLPGRVSSKDFEPSETEKIRKAFELDDSNQKTTEETGQRSYTVDRGAIQPQNDGKVIHHKRLTLSDLLSGLDSDVEAKTKIEDDYYWPDREADSGFDY